MFNDKYGLTQAVLEGHKTMTRRIIQDDFEKIKAYNANREWHYIADTKDGESVELKPVYGMCEKVAIAQSYKTIYDTIENLYGNSKANEWWCELYDVIGDPTTTKGYRNKMYVRSEFMPYHLRIIGVNIERLQDISEEDCLCEGVEKWIDGYIVTGIIDCVGMHNVCFDTPREAFAALIDRISGKGTWESNPFVFVYEFELEKQ